MYKYTVVIWFMVGFSANVLGQAQTQDSIPAKNPAAVKLIERLYGVWQAVGSQAPGQNNANAQSDLSIEFNPEAKYVLKRGNQIVESGSYRVNEQQEVIYLENSVNKKPVEWRVKLNGGNLVMTTRETDQGKSKKYTYRRVHGADTGTLDKPK